LARVGKESVSRVCMQALSRLCVGPADMELLGSTQQRLEVLQQSIGRMSSQAEQHGAVQQVRVHPLQ